MINNDSRRKLENIIRGVIIEGSTDNCTTTRNFLCRSFSTSPTVKKDFESKAIIKEEQAEALIRFAHDNTLWISKTPHLNNFLAKGSEASVYFDIESKSVIKYNDGIYYAIWLEFFTSISIHNLLFKDTAYDFLGFNDLNGVLHPVLK